MTDDIVTQLTDEGCYEMSCAILRGDAVHEIERLRKELQLAHSEIALMATAKVEEEPF